MPNPIYVDRGASGELGGLSGRAVKGGPASGHKYLYMPEAGPAHSVPLAYLPVSGRIIYSLTLCVAGSKRTRVTRAMQLFLHFFLFWSNGHGIARVTCCSYIHRDFGGLCRSAQHSILPH